MPDYIVAPTLQGVVSVPGRIYAPGESIPAHLVSEELFASGAVVAVAVELEPPARKAKK